MNSRDWQFEDAAAILGQKNLTDLWLTSCALSCVDLFEMDFSDNDIGILYPALNQKTISLFDTAVLYSSSRAYKKAALTGLEFRRVHSLLQHASDVCKPSNSSDDADDHIFRLLSSIANAQMRFQNNFWDERFGRALAMYEMIPRQYAQDLKLKHKQHFIDIPNVMNDAFGISVREFLEIGMAIIATYYSWYCEYLKPSDEMRKNILDLRKKGGTEFFDGAHKLIVGLVDHAKRLRSRLCFRLEYFTPFSQSVLSLDKINCFLELMSRSTKELSELRMKKEEYRFGSLSERLSPLERYPIVRLDTGAYIVPNLRYFNRAIPDALYYAMMERHKENEFTEVLGSIQEIFLGLLVDARLPHLIRIPEKQYIRNSSHFRGPDITIIDPTDDSMIVIESKAKHSSVRARIDPSDTAAWLDLQPIVETLGKMPRKVEDLYRGIQVYAPFQSEINRTRAKTPICVVVVGEGLYMLHKALTFHLRQNGYRGLEGFQYPFVLVDIESFEQAIETAASSGASLYQLLIDYWNNLQKRDLRSEPDAAFNSHSYQHERAFTTQFSRELFEAIRKKSNQ